MSDDLPLEEKRLFIATYSLVEVLHPTGVRHEVAFQVLSELRDRTTSRDRHRLAIVSKQLCPHRCLSERQTNDRYESVKALSL